MTTKQTIKYLKEWHNKKEPKRKDFETKKAYLNHSEIWAIEMLFLGNIFEELTYLNDKYGKTK